MSSSESAVGEWALRALAWFMSEVAWFMSKVE